MSLPQSSTPPLTAPNLPESSPSSTTGFFSLPPEIRLKIYYYVLFRPEGSSSCPAHTIHANRRDAATRQRSRDSQARTHMVSLLRANRQIYDEASTMLYRDFMVMVHRALSSQHARDFLGTLGPRAQGRIRWIGLRVIWVPDEARHAYILREGRDPPRSCVDAFTVLVQGLPALDKVTLWVERLAWNILPEEMGDWFVDQALEVARPFRRVSSLVLESRSKCPVLIEHVQRGRDRIRAGDW